MAEGQTSPEAQTVMARQVAAGQHGGVPSPAGLFPNARRRRAPHIDLNRVDREAAEENARRKARQDSERDKLDRKRAAADDHFLDVEGQIDQVGESVTRAPEQPPEPPAATEQQAPAPPADVPAEQAPGPAASKQEVPAEDWGEEPPAPPAAKKAAKKRAAKKAAKNK